MKPVGVGILGTGGWIGVLTAAIAKNKKFKIISCVSRDLEKAKKFAKEYSCGYDNSYEEMLKKEEIEAIIIGSPNYLHYEQTLLAAQSHKHVFVEKPIANDITEAKKMIEECKKNNVILSVGHNYRRNTNIRLIKSMIEQGKLGDIVMIEGNISHSGGTILTSDKWRWSNDKCPAGPLMQLGVHYIDNYIYLLGSIKKVSAIFNKLYFPSEIPNITTLIFEFSSGVLGYLGSNYISVGVQFINLCGTKATVCYSQNEPSFLYCHNAGEFFYSPKTVEKIPIEANDSIYEELDEFADCIRENKIPEVTGEKSLLPLAVVLAAIESVNRKATVEVEEILNK